VGGRPSESLAALLSGHCGSDVGDREMPAARRKRVLLSHALGGLVIGVVKAPH
jgi:hypothetical protein